jgi:hypothetical protein
MKFICCVHSILIVLFIGAAPTLTAQPSTKSRILRFVEGIDSTSKPMTADEVAQLNDPWAALVLRKGTFPKDITAALAAITPPAGQDGHSVQHSYFVSESGQLPVDAVVAREFRMVITKAKPVESLPTVLFSAPAGQRDGFIELMSWDPSKKSFNFYRRPKDGEWTWKGDTRTAFRSATAGTHSTSPEFTLNNSAGIDGTFQPSPSRRVASSCGAFLEAGSMSYTLWPCSGTNASK